MDVCFVCHEPLHKFVTVHAALGHLFCSRDCGCKYLAEHFDADQLATMAFDDCSEEVSTTEIGISQEV